MGFALLLLGLVPVMFLADMFFDQNDTEAEDPEAYDPMDSGDINEDGDFIAEPDDPVTATQSGIMAGLSPLQPMMEDEPPHAGSDIHPDDVLHTVEEDVEPEPGAPVDPDHVLSPIDEPGEDYAGDGTYLQDLLHNETGLNTGVEMLGQQIGDTLVTGLTDANDTYLADDDGVVGTGSGSATDWDGTPILADGSEIEVVSGEAGDDDITLGDRAAYAFGGDGNDTLTAGEGMAGLLGGDGDDTIAGQPSGIGLWADGGAGDDVISGTGNDDVLFGGENTAGDGSHTGDDTIDGGAGNDRIAGGYGADTLTGGAGDDVINHLGRAEEEIHWERHDFSWHIDNEADQLDGGDGNDRLILDRADTATGGEGMDTFWVYFDDASGDGAADIRDFAVGEDFLRISLNPEIDHGDLTLDVAPSMDGNDGLVRVNGELVAILRGAAAASTADVYVEVTANVFVA